MLTEGCYLDSVAVQSSEDHGWLLYLVDRVLYNEHAAVPSRSIWRTGAYGQAGAVWGGFGA